MRRYGFPKLACFLLGAVLPLVAQDVTIVNARIIGPDAGVIERGSIVVRGGKIVSVAPGKPPGTAGKTIDAKGMTAMPGFIDGHPHMDGVGIRLIKPSFDGLRSIEDVLAVIRREAAKRRE